MTNTFDINYFKANTNYIIDASAGTGKTYSIVEMITKLLLSGVKLENMAIVTYTEKAAEELKNRIRKKVKENNIATDQEIDSASIGTIHSFCQHAIEEFCISANKASNLEVIDEIEVKDYIRQYLRSKEVFNEVKTLFGQVTKLDSSIESNITDKLSKIIMSYYLDYSGNEVPAVVELINGINTDFIDTCLQVMDGKIGSLPKGNELKDAIDFLGTSSKPKLTDFYNDIKDSKNLIRPNNSRYPTVTAKDITPQEAEAVNIIKEYRDKIKSNFDSDFINIFVFNHGKKLYEKWFEEKKKRSVQTFNDMLRNVREEIVNKGKLLEKLQSKYTYAIIDEFQDTSALQWDIFKNIFLNDDHNIIVVGDPKQSIYSFQGADLNVYNSAKKEIEDKGGIVLALTGNYRSCESMVNSTNIFFDNKDALPENIQFVKSTFEKKGYKFTYDGKEEPAYWIFSNGKNKSENENETHDTEKKDGDSLLETKLTTQEEYLKAVCDTIIDCCSYVDGKTKLQVSEEKDGKTEPRNVSFKDFAILVRAKTEIPPIAFALENSGIPYIKNKDAALYSGRECANWISVLEAVNISNFSGKNRSFFKKALYTSFFGYTMKEINNSHFDRDSIPEMLLMDKWKGYVREGLWEDLINSIIIDSELSNKLQSVKYIKTYGVFKQIGDYCISYLNKTHSLDALISQLKKLSKNYSDDDESDNLTAKGTDFECVQIMTIHAAKGLEFPVVISAGGFKGINNKVELKGFHENNQYKIGVKLDDNQSELYKKEMEEEEKRIYYVAYTRPKYILILPSYDKPKYPFITDSIEAYKEYVNANMTDYKDKYRVITTCDKSYDELKESSEKILSVKNKKSATAEAEEKNQKVLLKKIIGAKSKHSSYKHAYSSLSHMDKKEIMNDDLVKESEGEDISEKSLANFDKNNTVVIPCGYDENISAIKLSDNFPAGASLGNALHAVFENIDYTKDIDTLDNRMLINDCFKSFGFNNIGTWEDDTVAIVHNTVNAKLPVIHGKEVSGEFSLKDIDFTHRKNEVEFNYNRENEVFHNYFNGFIDLIIEKDGYYSVLDWKSDRLTDEFISYSDADSMKEHIDDLYSIQRVLYSYTLIKWLKNFNKNLSYEEIFEKHFGGVYYVCIRGCNENTGNGIYAHSWDGFDALERNYNEIITERIGRK